MPDFDAFTHLILRSVQPSLVYAHSNNRKATYRTKLENLLNKSDRKIFSTFEVDCALVSSICDHLNVVETPAVFVLRNGVIAGSMTGTWAREAFNQMMEGSLRDEL